MGIARSAQVGEAEWDRRAHAVGVEWAGAYHGAATKRAARCLTCAHEWAVLPLNIYKGSGCPRCAAQRQGRRVNPAEWDRRAADAGLEWLEPHVRADVRRLARCLSCGFEYTPWPDHVRKGIGCPRCIVPVEEWDRRASAVGIEWIEPHSRADLPRRARCLGCGYEWSPPPRSVADGSGCPACATTGLDRSLPTIVYLILLDDPPLMKIGVANVGSRRLGDHRARGWSVVQEWTFDDGHEAEWVEATVMTWWRDCGAHPVSRDDVPGRDGYTESVWRGRIDIPDTVAFIADLIE